MGADKEIVNAAALAVGVETLGAGLSSFESSTRQMKGICEDFEGRLGKLEREMLPMKEISAKLSTSRRNIISAIGKMESINECFLLEKELRGVVQKGMRGNVGAVEYLEEMRRINDAIIYFRKWPSLKSQKDAIKGLEELSTMAAKECIDEFNRLMRTVGPAVQFQTQTNTFESVNTLSDNVAQSLAAIGECLTLLRHNKALRQNYTAARRVAVKTALDKWESKFESTPKGQQARGGGPWLRFYVDFSTKLVAAERLLWERALKASDSASSNGDMDPGNGEGGRRSSRRGHAGSEGGSGEMEAEEAFVMVVAPVIEKLVREVDRKLQSSLAEVRDRNKDEGGSGMGAATSGGSSHIRARARPASSNQAASKDGDIPADVVVSLMEMSDALHKGSYSLQDILKVGVDESSLKGDRDRDSRGGRRGSSSSSSARRGRSNKATDALAAVQGRLSRACLQTFADLAEAVSKDPKLRRHVPDNGAVHPLSSNVLRGIKRIMRFRRGYEELIQGSQMPWDPESVAGDRDSRSSKHSPVRERGPTAASNACPRFTALVNHLVKTLFVNLTEKSSSYPTATLPGAALRELFILNNAEYVLATAKTPFAGLALNSPGTAPSPTPAEEFRSIFGEAPSLTNAPDGARSPRSGGVKPRSPKRWGFGGSKNKEAVSRAAAARSAAEGLVGPDAGDDELQGLSIADFMTDNMVSLLKRLVQEKKIGYMDTLMNPLVEAAKDDVGELKYQRGKLLTLECGRVLKAKFTAFNDSWEEVYHSQMSVSVVDPGRRVKLKEEAKTRCLVPYRELYSKYEGVQFSKKHQEQYLKYTPDAIDQGISQLFSG
eukprot:g5770.t1